MVVFSANIEIIQKKSKKQVIHFCGNYTNGLRWLS